MLCIDTIEKYNKIKYYFIFCPSFFIYTLRAFIMYIVY